MNRPLRIGIIGDHDAGRLSHAATDSALDHTAEALEMALEVSWLPTPSLDATALDAPALDARSSETVLRQYDGLWCSPGGAYRSVTGALRAIRFAREEGWPFIGT